MLGLLLLAALWPRAGAAATKFTFERAVANIEIERDRLEGRPPASVTALPAAADGRPRWYGWIARRFEEDLAPLRGDRYVSFLVEYSDGVASRAWCDQDFDGDLADAPPMTLVPYPHLEEARSFLVDLRWMGRRQGISAPIEWTVRVVLERAPDDGSPPRFRVQMVWGMTGTVTLEGKPHRAFLLDGDADGFYTSGMLDGLFVDLDDDGHVVVDQMSHEYGSFRLPFTMDGRSYEVESIEIDGRALSMRDLGPSPRLPPPPAPGSLAPDFSYTDLGGRPVRLSGQRGRPVVVYFWASWCPACTAQAEDLGRLYDRLHPRGLEILGVSYDTDRAAMEAFRRRHAQTWPTSFSGRMVWEDPVGRLYRERGSGVAYLLDAAGLLVGRYTQVQELQARLAELMVADVGGRPPADATARR